MACSTTRLVPSRLGLGFFLVLERVGIAHSGTYGTEPSRSAIFKLTHYPQFGEVAAQLKLIRELLDQTNDHAQEIEDYGKNTVGLLAGANERLDFIRARIGDKTSN